MKVNTWFILFLIAIALLMIREFFRPGTVPPLNDTVFVTEIIPGDSIPYPVKIEKKDVGEIEEEDVIIRTSKQEAAKMMKNEAYVEQSFEVGGSSLEMVAGKTELAAKGYLGLYSAMTGKTITGEIISGFS